VATHDPDALALPQVFSPAAAAEVLRGLGLTEMTECALRTRAYRRQVPFHLNGRRIVFTTTDLREIIEGRAQRPRSDEEIQAIPPARPTTRRSSGHRSGRPPQTWRARSPLASSHPKQQ
jgi:hypothetical protein